ncbi:glycosyltransferase [Paracoccus onubensis]|uniref:glycosyltransferase n=1 Tax=Paracoccus onubensis TaxID=1675788 RepID=UPI0027321ABD|nr:glycosyltransferase [Paracoccus onubensis]MDP0928014.1 glycosyltransferase [Paracoccus onubensis]
MSSRNSEKSELLASGLFDPDWYLERNGDVKLLGMDPLEHYLWLGHRLNRSPGPKFDSDRYLRINSDVARHKLNPVLHYIRHGRAEGRQAFEVSAAGAVTTGAVPGLRRVAGGVATRPGRPVVMLCSHIAGDKLFGGERSLLDMLDGLNALDFNVIVTVPGADNPAYFETLRTKSVAAYILSYGWWRDGTPVNDAVTAQFSRIIADETVDVVHTNTIVLREPLIAARRMGVRSIIHVRELIRHDDALLNMIGESADAIVEKVWNSCDRVIVNSMATLSGFAQPGREAALVYNTVDFRELAHLSPATAGDGLRVGLISSNLPKKGLWDFVRVAQELAALPEISFRLIGPENEHTAIIAAKIQAGELSANLRLIGYRETPAQAVAETDIVLSLSHFQESFGRTVLEGMAAGRPAIVYDHGAPPEFVAHGETGFVVPVGDTGAVADTIRKLASDREGLRRMGLAARAKAIARFDRTAYINQLRSAYEGLDHAPEPQRLRLPARRDLTPQPRETMKVAYFCWHFPVPSETFVLNELRLLREQGFDVRVFCRQSPYPDFRPDFDIEWETVRDAAHLAERLTGTGRSIVHSHFVYPTVTDMVWPACEAAKIPFTFIAHAQDIFRYRNDAMNRIGEVAHSDWCRKVFVPSRFHRQYLAARNVPDSKMMISPNGCDPRLYAKGWKEGREKRPFRRIIAIHRFTEKKGLIHLIRAGKLLEQDNIRIELYGYGELEEVYRAVIAEEGISNVAICGPVKGRDAMLALYRESDLFACPSVRAADGDMDGIPTVLMEAMAAGLPVLTTDLSGIPDLIEDGITGLVSDATPEALAARIRAYYMLPDVAVAAMIENAAERIRKDYNSEHLVDNLIRVWAGETIDLMIVSWNNLAQTSEVIRRLYKYTSLPFHLIICDNGSDAPALAQLMELYGERDNITILLNRDNAMVGPGTNLCLAEGKSDYAIYVCGKEGITTRYGWETAFIRYMNAHPRVGQAGTLCYSPSYLFGRDYPKAQALWDKFRNQEFALNNLDRSFSHVQGGFFALRRKMIDEIGGFSDAVPHNSTDVEFSYYVESCGWELGEVPGIMSLFNKTRPGLFHRIDEHMGALHPPRLEDLPALDAIARCEVYHCNACGRQSVEFVDLDGAAACPDCGADRRARAIHRVLAESILLYRRLPALGVNVPAALEAFWREQFQGRVCNAEELTQDIARNGRIDLADSRLQLILLNDATGAIDDDRLLSETARVLAPGGTLMIAGRHADAPLTSRLRKMGLVPAGVRRYISSVSHYDWLPVLLYTHTHRNAAAAK